MTTEVREIKKSEIEEYNELVKISKEGTLFHLSWWLDSFKDIYKYKYSVKYIGYYNNNELISAIPIPIHKRGLFKFIYQPKLTPYLGSIFYPMKGKYCTIISRVKEINEKFAKIIKNNGITLLYPFSFEHVDLQPYMWNKFNIGVKYTYIIDLTYPLNVIWENMSKKRRNEIRNAEKSRIHIIEDDLSSFLELNYKTFKRQKKIINLEKFWKKIFNECSKRDCCKIWTVYQGDTPMASLFLVWDNKRAYYIGGGINENSKGTMSLLIWHAIKFSKGLGLREFDFEGSNIPTIEMYFRKFGGFIKPIFYISDKSLRAEIMLRLYYWIDTVKNMSSMIKRN